MNAPDGSYLVTVVDGTEFTGFYAPDGSWNVFVVDGTEFVGAYHPCGAINVIVSTQSGWYHPSGALQVSSSPYVSGTIRMTPDIPLDLSGYRFYSDFAHLPAGSPDGVSPQKGSAFAITGGAAADVVISDGLLTQDADTYPTSAGYTFIDLGAVPAKITASWIYSTGTVDLPSTMGICQANDGGATKFLHGEGDATNFLLRLFDPGRTTEASGGFILPSWWLRASDFALTAATPYQTELHYDGGTMAAMVLKDSDGTVIGQEVAYDPDMPNWVGDFFFAETFNTKLGYSKLTEISTSDYTFPSPLTALKETTFPTDADGFTANPYGGTATWDASGVTITGSAYANGGSVSIGAISNGDRIWVSFDTTSLTGAGIMALIGTGQTGVVLSTIEQGPTAVGRTQWSFVANADSADASFLIGWDGATGTDISAVIRGLSIYKNPPETL